MVYRTLLLFFVLFSLALSPAQRSDNCQRPPHDYTQVKIGSATLNARTLAMLAHAQTLYSGTIDLTGAAITQGSYTGGRVSLSFGTHDGGGAVDISVRNLPQDWSIRWDDIPLVIEALRAAGFAAWFRDERDGMTPHIHAIAVGDAELSRAASLQLDGRYGYFRGFDGLPQADGVPHPDDDGDLVLCDWMVELGYADLRGVTQTQHPPYNITVGDRVYVNTLWGETLNFRRTPTLQGEILAQLPSETPLRVVAAPRSAEGYRWWLLRTEDGQLGWAVDSIDTGFTLVP